TIGKLLAERLNLKYYDKELVKRISLETGFDPKYIEEHGEYAQSKSIFAYMFGGQSHPDVMKGMTPADFLWCMQRDIILDIAEKEACVIVGRCADYILKDRDDCLNVFIHAPEEKRAERIVKLYGESDVAPEKRLHDKDARRKVNYRHFTGREWGVAQNYHMALDSGTLGIEGCVDLIAAAFRREE
ncbi:MAG: AAA family ATPase, partial [Aristaeellaceae bacterium]